MNQKKRFYVIELAEKPYPDPDKYVVIPFSWIRFCESMEGEALVKFPIEALSETKKRVRREEMFSDDWMIFSADVKYATDSYEHANEYIDMINVIYAQELNRVKEIEKSLSSTSRILESPITSLRDKSSVREKSSSLTNNSTEPMVVQVTPETTISEVELSPDKDSAKRATDSNSSPRRYFTRQTVRMSSPSAAKLGDETAKNNFQKANECAEETSEVTSNQEKDTQLSQLPDEWEIIKILRSVLGDDYKEILHVLHAEYKKIGEVIAALTIKNLNNCKLMEKLIRLVDKVDDCDDATDTQTWSQSNLNTDNEMNDNTKEVTGKYTNDTDTRVTDEENARDVEYNRNNTGNKIRGQASKFTLPPEYDPEDSKWTLKHRKKQKGLVELMPKTGVYVDAIRLNYCKRISTDSKSLARLLLVEVFSENALRVCSVMGNKANAFDLEGTDIRPGLDTHARTVLLNYVEQHAVEQKWAKVEWQVVMNSIRNKMSDMRLRSK